MTQKPLKPIIVFYFKEFYIYYNIILLLTEIEIANSINIFFYFSENNSVDSNSENIATCSIVFLAKFLIKFFLLVKKLYHRFVNGKISDFENDLIID